VLLSKNPVKYGAAYSRWPTGTNTVDEIGFITYDRSLVPHSSSTMVGGSMFNVFLVEPFVLQDSGLEWYFGGEPEVRQRLGDHLDP